MARRWNLWQLAFRFVWRPTAPPPSVNEEIHARLLRFYAERRAARLGITLDEAMRDIV